MTPAAINAPATTRFAVFVTPELQPAAATIAIGYTGSRAERPIPFTVMLIAIATAQTSGALLSRHCSRKPRTRPLRR